MVPSRYNLKATSYGEQQIFHALEALPPDYTVLHSMALNGHAGKLFAEIDFVIICPRGVLCLEVKGGRIKCQERQWYSYGGYDNQPRKIQNPFSQAQSASAALYESVKDYFKTNRTITGVCFGAGVAFPDITFTERGPEVRTEIVYDKQTGCIQTYINRVFDYWSEELRRRFSYPLTGLSANARGELERFLYRSFDIVYTIGTKVRQVEQETLRLAEDQKQILDYVGQNPRLLLQGGAGTGKTILCLEQALRQARAGQQVLFLCFNHNLANNVHHRASLLEPELVGVNLHIWPFFKYLETVLAIAKVLPSKPAETERKAYNHYWQELPQLFLNLASKPSFDMLVMDEGQDLLKPEYLQCLEGLLPQSLAEGSWLIALDPRQNIYRTNIDEGMAWLAPGQPARISLQNNYRNTRQIIQYTIENTGIDPQVKPLIEGIEIREEFYSPGEQKIKLVKVLEELRKQEVPPASICIVSMTSFEKSVLQGNPKAGKFSVQDLSDLYPGQWNSDLVKFSSVHRFKGLEAPVVILTDLVQVEGDWAPRAYTAMTRAQALLWLLKQQQ